MEISHKQLIFSFLILLWLSVTGKPSTLVSGFQKLDVNELCIFGDVTQLPLNEADGNICKESGCQVAVYIKKTEIWKSVDKEWFLALNVTPKGQTLHTLTHIYVNITYPDKYQSNFVVTLFNLNGHHKYLIKMLEMKFPFDKERCNFTKENPETILLSIQSRCACNGTLDKKEIEILEPLEIDMFRSGKINECRREKGKFSPRWSMICIICFAGFIIIIIIIALCLSKKKSRAKAEMQLATPRYPQQPRNSDSV